MAKFKKPLWNELHNLSVSEVEAIRKYELEPNGISFFSVAETLRKRGYLEEAIVIMEDGVDKFPNYSSARATLAKDYYAKGMHQDALREAKQVVSKNPDNIQAQRLLLKLSLYFCNKVEVKGRLNTLKILPEDDFTREVRAYLSSEDWHGARSLVIKEMQKLGLISENEPTAVAEEFYQDTTAIEQDNFPLEDTKATQVVFGDTKQSTWELPQENIEVVTQTKVSLEQKAEIIQETDDPSLPYLLKHGPSLAQVKGDSDKYIKLLGFRRINTENNQTGKAKNSSDLEGTTLAEIYVSQGKIENAISIYEALTRESPMDLSYQKRLQELQLKVKAVASIRNTTPEYNELADMSERISPEKERKLRFLESLLTKLEETSTRI